MWVRCESFPVDRAGRTAEISDVDEDLKHGNSSFAQRAVAQCNTDREDDRERTLELCLSADFGFASIRGRNTSLMNLTGNDAAHDLMGSVVAMKKVGPELLYQKYEDMTLHDFHDVIDSLKGVVDVAIPETFVNTDQKGVIKGVKVTCLGEQQYYRAKKYVSVDIPRFQYQLQLQGRSSPISSLAGFPVRGRKYPLKRDLYSDAKAYSNREIGHLFREVDPPSTAWGMTHHHWDFHVGSVLLVREDEQDLTPQQAEALCAFCEEKIQPLIKEASEHNMVDETGRGSVVSAINPWAFREFYEDYRRRMIKDQGWTGATSPTEIDEGRGELFFMEE
ncbi:MAG: hypothetical protein Q9190_000170 [Brigantiaea leucoxantha]